MDFPRRRTTPSLCLKGGGKLMAELDQPEGRRRLGLTGDDVHCATAT
jgi:hypothetical protein